MQVPREDVGALAIAVMRLTDRMRRSLTEAIDRTELGVLRVVAAHQGARPTEIAQELNVHPSSVTRHARVLAESGRLTIKPDPADGRASLLEVTPTGLAELWQLYEQGVDAFQDAIAGWTPAEVRTLAAGLTRLVAALDAREAHHAEPARHHTEPARHHTEPEGRPHP